MCMIDSAEVYYRSIRREIRRARKVHRCSECDRSIDPGEEYHYEFGMCDGYSTQAYACIHCWSGPCAWLIRECRGYLFEGVSEDLIEHLEYASHEMNNPISVAKWLDRMRKQWRRKDGSLMRVPTLPRPWVASPDLLERISEAGGEG